MSDPFPFLGCFFCGVDSKALLYFFLVFVISIVLASLTFLAWAISKGDFRNVESAKYDIFNDPEQGNPNSVAVPSLLEKAKPHESKT
jgi:nitrogen fixation-related uncharacterized protein